MGNSGSTPDESLLVARREARVDRQAARSLAWTGPELLELLADGIVSSDESGRIIFFNRAAEGLFG